MVDLSLKNYKLYRRQLKAFAYPTSEASLKLSCNYYFDESVETNQYLLVAPPNGFTKEMFVPLIRSILELYKFRGILTYDIRNQGDSALLNKGKLDHTMLWDNYGRDILSLLEQNESWAPDNVDKVKTKQIFGVGSSLSGTSFLWLGTQSLPPTVTLKTIVAVDPPTLYPEFQLNKEISTFEYSKRRRGWWPTLKDAEKHLLRNKMYQAWEKEVFELFMEYALYPALGPDNKTKGLALKCTPEQEYKTFTDDFQFQVSLYESLPNLIIPTLLVSGTEESTMLVEEILTNRAKVIPSCRALRMQGVGHLIPYEAPKRLAKEIVDFLLQIQTQELKSKL